MQQPRILLLIAAALGTGLGGCTFQTPNSIRRIWCDHNTLQAPALYLEKHDHLPYRHARVDYYRWTYNMGPIVPVAPVPPPEWERERKRDCFDQKRLRTERCESGTCAPTLAPTPLPVRIDSPTPMKPVPDLLPPPDDLSPPPSPATPPGNTTDAPMTSGPTAIQLATGEATAEPGHASPVRPPGAWLFGQ